MQLPSVAPPSPGPPNPATPAAHLCPKLELVESLADFVQVVVLLLCLCLYLRRLLPIPNLLQAMRADTRVGLAAARVAAPCTLLLLPPVVLHGLLVGGHAGVIAGTRPAHTNGRRRWRRQL